MFCLRLILILLAAYASMTTFASGDDSRESDAQVWKVGQRQWTNQEELNYGKWIETNITEDFFIRHGIPVDCADVPYAIRWIYARISHLPAAATTVGNRFIGHWSRDWGHLPTSTVWHKDRRFRAALITMLSTTSTRTLPYDTYPIRIIPESVTPGTIYLIAESHAGMVTNIVMDGSVAHPVQTFEANLPTRIQKLHLRNFTSPDPDPAKLSGLIKFRWPVEKGGRWHYPSVKEHPFYSREQYSPSFCDGYGDYIDAVAKRIDPQIHNPHKKIKSIMNTLTERLKERIPIVLDGNKTCREVPCPEGSRLWEIYSTPERDEFIQVMVDHMEEMIRKNHLDRNAVLGQMADIRLQVSPDRLVTAQHIFQNAKWMSSNPEATIDERWALDRCRLITAHLKSAQESISFIKKTYGKADAHFADRSLRTQQATVDEMAGEIRKSNCTASSNR